MRLRLLSVLACCLSLLAPRGAVAAPIVIDASRAATLPREAGGPGPGICATAVHLSADDALTSTAAAQFYLDQPVGTNQVDDKTRFMAPTVNFHNSDPAALTDYPNAAPLPFSSLSGSPKRGNDRDLAMRVRGYVNITRAGIFTFAVLADDGYSLSIGALSILQSSSLNASLRDSQQVEFGAAGLYPLELVYFKNRGPAVLDLAVSARADAEVRMYNQTLGPGFQLVNQTGQVALYPTLAGTTDCTECTTDASCGAGAGRYCGNGVCQSCILSNHCGASCVSCDRTGQVCTNGQCVGCTYDLQCGVGKTCDIAFGQCIPRPALTYGGGCSATRSTGSDASPAGLFLLGLGALLTLRRGRWSFRPVAAASRSHPRGRPSGVGRGGVRAPVSAPRLGADADPAVRPGRYRRDRAA